METFNLKLESSSNTLMQFSNIGLYLHTQLWCRQLDRDRGGGNLSYTQPSKFVTSRSQYEATEESDQKSGNK